MEAAFSGSSRRLWRDDPLRYGGQDRSRTIRLGSGLHTRYVYGAIYFTTPIDRNRISSPMYLMTPIPRGARFALYLSSIVVLATLGSVSTAFAVTT